MTSLALATRLKSRTRCDWSEYPPSAERAAQSTVSLWMFETERVEASKRFDQVCRIVFPIAYFVATAWLLRD